MIVLVEDPDQKISFIYIISNYHSFNNRSLSKKCLPIQNWIPHYWFQKSVLKSCLWYATWVVESWNRQRAPFIETGFETLSLVIPLCSFLCTSNHDQLLWDDTAAVVMWIQKMIHAIVISDIALLPENIST